MLDTHACRFRKLTPDKVPTNTLRLLSDTSARRHSTTLAVTVFTLEILSCVVKLEVAVVYVHTGRKTEVKYACTLDVLLIV